MTRGERNERDDLATEKILQRITFSFLIGKRLRASTTFALRRDESNGADTRISLVSIPGK